MRFRRASQLRASPPDCWSQDSVSALKTPLPLPAILPWSGLLGCPARLDRLAPPFPKRHKTQDLSWDPLESSRPCSVNANSVRIQGC